MANSRSPGQDRSQGEHEQELQSQQQINAEFAKAFQELAQGERTASALESRLDGIESRIEQLLASVEENARQQSGRNGPPKDGPLSDNDRSNTKASPQSK